MINPGTYKLKHRVINPCPDARYTRDWRKQPAWREGTEFLVVQNRGRHIDPEVLAVMPDDAARQRLIDSVSYTTIRMVGHRWSHHEVGPGNEEQYAALLAALEPIAETPEAMFTRLHIDEYFARWLVTSGRMKPDELETLWRTFTEEDS